MIRLPAFLIAVLGAALLQPVSAQERLPPLVTKGLQALQEQRCRDAFDIWTADWQWPRDTERRHAAVVGQDRDGHRFQETHAAYRTVAALVGARPA